MKISAIDLVNKYIEFKSWTKGLEKDYVLTQDFEPAFYRYKQLKVLFELYKLNKIEDLEQGGFLLERKIEDYELFFEKADIDMFTLKEWKSFLKPGDKKLTAISSCFKRLLKYKILLFDCKNFKSTFHKGSGLYIYSVFKIEQMNAELVSKSSILDTLLSQIISPENLQFDLQFLKENHEYPDVNLEEIDYAYNS